MSWRFAPCSPCCGLPPCPCSIPCNPVNLPSALAGDGPVTLSFGGASETYTISWSSAGGGWGIACPSAGGNSGVPSFGGSLMTTRLYCGLGGHLAFFLQLTDDCNHPTESCRFSYNGGICDGTAGSGCVPLVLVDHTQDPLHLHFQPSPSASPDQPGLGGSFPFTDIYLDAPLSQFVGSSYCLLVNLGCAILYGFVVDADVTVSNTTGYSRTKNTGIHSYVTFGVPGPGTYTVEVEADNYPTFTETFNIQACGVSVNLSKSLGTAQQVTCCSIGNAVDSDGVPFSTSGVPSYMIPANLTLTGAGGTIPFTNDLTGPLWTGKGEFAAGNIAVDVLIIDGVAYVQLGSGVVEIAYGGQCSSPALRTNIIIDFEGNVLPEGYFAVSAGYHTACISKTPITIEGFGGEWYRVCPDTPEIQGCNVNDGQCVYVGKGAGSGYVSPFGGSGLWTGAVPSSYLPFAWSGVVTFNQVCPIFGSDDITPCPAPGGGVTISA